MRDDSFETLYTSQYDFLCNVAVRKFRVPDTEAGTLVHDVFLTYLRRSETILDKKRWLLGAICHASRYYWRSHSRDLPAEEQEFDRVDPSTQNIEESLPNQLAARQVLEGLEPRCQEVLFLRYFDGYSIQEIADRYGLKVKYTQKLVTKCLRRAEKSYKAKEKKKGKR